jgi:DUF4097 and DUF4098 domain-containing protein YvlB
MKIPILALAALAISAGGLAAQREINETHRTPADGRVEIHNLAGSVRVVGWDRNEIRINGTLGRGAERLEVSPRGSTTEIRVILPRRGRNVQGSDLEVRVPAGKEVVVRTTSAEIGVSDIVGAVSAHTTSGEVRVTGRPSSVSAVSTSGDVDVEVTASNRVQARSTSGDVRVDGSVRGSVEVESTSGDVQVSAATPEIRAQSVSGDVSLRGASGRVSASTVSGDTEIADSRIQYGSFETVSGRLRFQGGLQRGGAFNLQSHSGDVELLLPADAGAEFEVKTFSGDIDTEFPVQAQRTSRHGPGQELRFTTGGGGALVTVKTFSGNVKLLRR